MHLTELTNKQQSNNCISHSNCFKAMNSIETHVDLLIPTSPKRDATAFLSKMVLKIVNITWLLKLTKASLNIYEQIDLFFRISFISSTNWKLSKTMTHGEMNNSPIKSRYIGAVGAVFFFTSIIFFLMKL